MQFLNMDVVQLKNIYMLAGNTPIYHRFLLVLQWATKFLVAHSASAPAPTTNYRLSPDYPAP